MGRLPKICKGRKLYDAIDGSEIYERDSTTTKQRGQWIHKKNYDRVLDKDRPK